MLATVPVLITLTTQVQALDFNSLVDAVRRHGPEARRAFVEIASAELATDYRALAAEARPGDPGWASRTRAYAADLERAAAAARAGSRVVLLRGTGGVLRVIVGRAPARQFELSTPRGRTRAELEAAVLERYCARHGCGAGVVSHSQAPLAATRQSAAAQAPTGPRYVKATSPPDIRCAVADRHVRLQVRACERLRDATRALLRAVESDVDQGLEPDWTRPAATRVDDARIAPLARYPALDEAVGRWIRARLTGNVRPLLIEPPARLVYASARR